MLTDNASDLVAIDAGTQPGSLEAAYDFLQLHRPDLPTISAAFITHAHWDHIGGHTWLRRHNPDIRIYGSDRFRPVVRRVLRHHAYRQFRGNGFDPDWVRSYAPDVEITERTTITVGDTTFDLIPVTGGETEDAMLIHLPDLETVFVGDIVMPWYGEPWVNEGFIDEAVETMDVVNGLGAVRLLHGHHPLTMLYGPKQLRVFRDNFAWLVETTREHLRSGYSAKDIVRLNLIPPGLENHPENYLSFLAARDNVIARVADHMVGIWREDVTGLEPEGLDTLTSVEYGRMLEKISRPQAGERCQCRPAHDRQRG